ncbi:hypothetical protein KUV51_20595 [Tateyamaria omphalii]|uniref:calcium-binding protein n=1 Tax=Tateyamaria omphalii TaxID=299262 RepID=UPI001C98E845|nr:calcium-binding protein [Tateyamaria omphalii]MBY5935418.1 hypothetical protein [Tateyamaria omphalii]
MPTLTGFSWIRGFLSSYDGGRFSNVWHTQGWVVEGETYYFQENSTVGDGVRMEIDGGNISSENGTLTGTIDTIRMISRDGVTRTEITGLDMSAQLIQYYMLWVGRSSANEITAFRNLLENAVDTFVSVEVPPGQAYDIYLRDQFRPDVVQLQNGDSVIIYDGPFLEDIEIIGSEGFETITLSLTANGIHYLFDAAGVYVEGLRVDFEDIDSVVLSGRGATATGSEFGADRITMTSFSSSTVHNTIEGRGGDDTLTGGYGPDSIVGGVGNDVVRGNTGTDTLIGGLGFDHLLGEEGNDSIVGMDGYDTILGGAGDDHLFGNNGFDVIAGGAGNDLMFGGVGLDTLAGGTGDDEITGGSGGDVLSGNDGNDTLFGNSGADRLTGGAGADHMFGGINFDTLTGGDGDDWLSGGNGSDVLHGEAGNDRLEGNAGNDTLYGGAGENFLRGGIGADTFLFLREASHDVIADFQTGIDVLHIQADLLSQPDPSIADLRSVETTDENGFLVFDFGNGSLTIAGIASLSEIETDIILV